MDAFDERVKLLAPLILALLHLFDRRLHFVHVAVELAETLAQTSGFHPDTLNMPLVDDFEMLELVLLMLVPEHGAV